jgi:hypothetical protein
MMIMGDSILKNIQANDEKIRRHINECALSSIQAGMVELQKSLRDSISLCPPPNQEYLLQNRTPVCSIGAYDKYRQDCYYYDERQEMGAHIPICENKHCSDAMKCRNCKHYLSQEQANEIIDNWIADNKTKR